MQDVLSTASDLTCNPKIPKAKGCPPCMLSIFWDVLQRDLGTMAVKVSVEKTFCFSTDLFTPDPQRLLVRQLPAANSGPQRQAAGANWVGPLQHYIQRRALAGAKNQFIALICDYITSCW